MAIRGLVLLLTTGFFVAVWQGDRNRPERPAVGHEQPVSRDRLPSCGFVAAWRHCPEVPVLACVHSAHAPISLAAFHEERWFEPCIAGDIPSFEPAVAELPSPADVIPLAANEMFVACEPPLPEGIRPGEYRVVGSNGAMFPLELTAEEIAYHGLTAGTVDRHLYQIDHAGRRWYFIRIGIDVPQIAVEPSVELEPAVAEKPATAIDWSEVLIQLPAGLRCDVQMAAWCSEETVDRWSRQLAALLRQGDGWATRMTETLQQSLQRIRRAERISKSNESGPRL